MTYQFKIEKEDRTINKQVLIDGHNHYYIDYTKMNDLISDIRTPVSKTEAEALINVYKMKKI